MGRYGPTIAGVVVVVGLVALGLVVRCQRWHAKQDLAASGAAREATRTRGMARADAMGSFEPCVDQLELDELVLRGGPGVAELDVSCLQELDTLADDAHFLPDPARAALQRLRAGSGDDHRAALREVRRVALPLLRDRIGALLGPHAHDAAWWRVHVALAWWHLLDVAITAARIEDGSDADLMAASAAARPVYEALVTETGSEAVEIQRAVHAADYATQPIARGEAVNASDLGRLAHEVHISQPDLAALGSAAGR